jgi:hypothetical protein
MRSDKELLDGMQKAAQGLGWILRDSVYGRGLRLHETGRPKAFCDIRQAIDHGLTEIEGKAGP